MKSRAAFLIAGMALAVVSQSSLAQQQDFSGTWVMDVSRSESALQAIPVNRATLVIRQTPATVSIERLQDGGEQVIRYNTDGSDTTSPIPSGRATGSMQLDAGRLVTKTVYHLRGIPLNQTASYTLSSDGKEMTVETELVVPHGYEQSRRNALHSDPNHAKGKDVYIRR